MHAGLFLHLGPSLVLALGKGCALLSLLTSASAVSKMPQRGCGSYGLLLCSALFLEPWRLGKAASAASYALQGKRRLPGHLKVFLDLTPEASIATRLPAPPWWKAGSGHALFPWLHSPLACSQQLISSRCLQLRWPQPSSFLFIFYPALQRALSRGMPWILSTVCAPAYFSPLWSEQEMECLCS